MYEQISQQETIEFRPEHKESCERAKQFENFGEYDAAVTALGDLWLGIGLKPNFKGFPKTCQADILVRIGTLTGWMGSAGQIEGSQEAAKDLISAGLRIYEDESESEKIADAQSDLAICYWREGSFPEAENFLTDALNEAPIENLSLRGKIMLRLVNVAISSCDYDRANFLLKDAEKLVKEGGDHLLKGTLYSNKALVHKLLFEENNKLELAEKAAKFYSEARFHYRQANHKRYEAKVETNLGNLYLALLKFDEAHKHFDTAIKIFSSIQDSGRMASVFDSKAKVYVADKKYIEAELFAQKAVQLFSRGQEYFSLSASFMTLGIAFARQKAFADAKESFEKAVEASEIISDTVNIGLALLTQIEELHKVLSAEERKSLFARATELLGDSDSSIIIKRLKNAELICMDPTAKSKWEDFSLSEKVLEFEAKFIMEALVETEGRVTKAANLLGLSHQNLSLLLKTRHIALASAKKSRKKRSDRKRKTRKS